MSSRRARRNPSKSANRLAVADVRALNELDGIFKKPALGGHEIKNFEGYMNASTAANMKPENSGVDAGVFRHISAEVSGLGLRTYSNAKGTNAAHNRQLLDIIHESPYGFEYSLVSSSLVHASRLRVAPGAGNRIPAHLQIEMQRYDLTVLSPQDKTASWMLLLCIKYGSKQIPDSLALYTTHQSTDGYERDKLVSDTALDSTEAVLHMPLTTQADHRDPAVRAYAESLNSLRTELLLQEELGVVHATAQDVDGFATKLRDCF